MQRAGSSIDTKLKFAIKCKLRRSKPVATQPRNPSYASSIIGIRRLVSKRSTKSIHSRDLLTSLCTKSVVQKSLGIASLPSNPTPSLTLKMSLRAMFPNYIRRPSRTRALMYPELTVVGPARSLNKT